MINIEGYNFLHVVDKGTGWSELGLIRRKLLKEQIKVFRAIQIYRHGLPTSITGDQEYNKKEFKEFCSNIAVELISTPAYDHEANGTIESANRTIRSYFNRLRAVDKKTATADLVAEAAYGKNICKGSKLATLWSSTTYYGRI